jgi:hypothetical protein
VFYILNEKFYFCPHIAESAQYRQKRVGDIGPPVLDKKCTLKIQESIFKFNKCICSLLQRGSGHMPPGHPNPHHHSTPQQMPPNQNYGPAGFPPLFSAGPGAQSGQSMTCQALIRKFITFF